jgi:glycine cleavage system H protein
MAHTPFHGEIPDDLLYDTHHDMWVRELPDGEVLIGITAFGVFLAGEIIAFTAKPKGAEVEHGRGLGTVESAKTVLAVHAPLAFSLLEANEALEERPEPINREPYAAWLVRGQPHDWSAARTGLVEAAAYRDHILAVEPAASFA